MIQTTTRSHSTIPPLENGDFLTREEFERRYDAMPHLKKAELIEGIVYMASPVRITNHGSSHAKMITWLGNYWAGTPGIELGDNSTVRLNKDNEVQPDALLRIKSGGQSTISEEGYIEGAPELIVEIAASNASIDLHKKLDIYCRHQVQEYIVWRVDDGKIDWFRLQEDKYILKLEPNSEGMICSEVFAGLWLDISAMLAGKLARVIEGVKQGLLTAQHQEFTRNLQKKKK